jgi:Domain of unknown function (DUF4249)
MKFHQKSIVQGMVTLVSVVLAGCIQDVTDPVELPYEEKIVVQGFLEAGQPLNNIVISRTLPPLDSAIEERFYIADADVRVTVDGREYKAENIPRRVASRLRYSSVTQVGTSTYVGGTVDTIFIDRPYFVVPNLTVESGKTYSLRVTWNGKKATAETRIPTAIQPVAGSLRLREENDTTTQTFSGRTYTYINTSIRAEALLPVRTDECYIMKLRATDTTINPVRDDRGQYTGAWRLDTITILGRYGTALYQPYSDAAKIPVIVVPPGYSSPTLSLSVAERTGRTLSGLQTSGSPTPGDVRRSSVRFFVKFFAFDAPYYNYITTLYRNSLEATNPLSSGNGQSPLWNVKGDGIGVFIGLSSREIEVKR